MSVEDNIRAILEIRRDLNPQAKSELLEELLTELGIEHVRRQKGYTLSGGERRRTEIARSLAAQPRFLLLDEPFAGIDPIAVHEIKRIVRSLAARGIGILITDHNVRDTLGDNRPLLYYQHGRDPGKRKQKGDSRKRNRPGDLSGS